MKEISQGQIMSGIAAALKKQFPSSHIYKHNVPQALCEGDFVVSYITSVRPERMRNRVLVLSSFEITYYGIEDSRKPDSLIDNLLAVETVIPAILHTITTPSGAVVHALNDLTISQIEDRLHITVRYQHHAFEKIFLVETDEDGNPIVDEDGNPLVDDKGNPIPVDAEIYGTAMMEVLERDSCTKGAQHEEDENTGG